jgi:hypothetical protein
MSSLDIAAQPWVFTQSAVLSTRDFMSESAGRGIELNWRTLKALHARGVLSPLFAVHDSLVGTPVAKDPTRPRMRGTYTREFVEALGEGRLTDPTLTPLQRGWRFDNRSFDDPKRWWNGLLYSRWQVLQLPMLPDYLSRGHVRGPDRSVALPQPDEFLLSAASRSRTLSLVLTAVEARYLPQLTPNILSLHNVEAPEWTTFRDSFDPEQVAVRLEVTAEGLRNDADRLLVRARRMDPLGTWYHVVKHSAPKHWEKLTGEARLAMDLRMGAEILLMFSEDLTGAGRIPDPTGNWWTPLHERLTPRVEPLEAALVDHGAMPGPRVVVILEGQSELTVARRICDHAGLDPSTLGMRIICARGGGGLGAKGGLKPVSRLAAHLLTPVITERLGDSYTTLEPLCGVMVAADPQDIPGGPQALAKKLIDEVQRNLHDQEVDDVDRDALEHLLRVHTWHSEFEFAHFTDDEIADALFAIDPDGGGLTRQDVVGRLDSFRREGKNISHVWSGWKPSPSKVSLADALWPLLREQIDATADGKHELPEIADVLWSARDWAIEMALVRYVLPTRPRGDTLVVEPGTTLT